MAVSYKSAFAMEWKKGVRMDDQSQNYLASLFCGANAGQKPSFAWREDIAVSSGSDWQARQSRANADCENIERALTLLLGELAGLEVDADIFRGELPAPIDDGFMVRLTSLGPARNPCLMNITATCRGRHADHAVQLAAAARLTGKLPLPAILSVSGRTLDAPITFLKLSMSRPAAFSAGADGGITKAFCELDFEAQIIP